MRDNACRLETEAYTASPVQDQPEAHDDTKDICRGRVVKFVDLAIFGGHLQAAGCCKEDRGRSLLLSSSVRSSTPVLAQDQHNLYAGSFSLDLSRIDRSRECALHHRDITSRHEFPPICIRYGTGSVQILQ